MSRDPGTYALILSSWKRTVIKIGRLGRMRLERGFYLYVGSALGPGGLHARIAHHARHSKRPHWHIDYLRCHTRLDQIWCCRGTARREHVWARAIQELQGASIPLPGFGSSDCDCASHLYFFDRPPSRRAFERILRALVRCRLPAVEAVAVGTAAISPLPRLLPDAALDHHPGTPRQPKARPAISVLPPTPEWPSCPTQA